MAETGFFEENLGCSRVDGHGLKTGPVGKVQVSNVSVCYLPIYLPWEFIFVLALRLGSDGPCQA